jgi:integrase
MDGMAKKSRHGTGSIYRRPNSPYWWAKYFVDGQPRYESTKKTEKTEAARFLQSRLGAVANQTLPSRRTEKIAISDLLALVLDNYRRNGLRSISDAERRIRLHLKPHIGAGKAASFGTSEVARYIGLRQEEGAANESINHELNLVRRGFNLAYRADPPLVSRVPHIERLSVDNVRRGFFEHGQYLALRSHLPLHLQVFLVLAYNTGARRSELLGDNRKDRKREPLRWDQIDFKAKRIYFPRTKNGDARTVPFIEDMEQWLRAAWDAHQRDWPQCPYVIQHAGRPVFDPRKTWKRACIAAGVPDLWRHDLRRSAVRNLDRAGVPQKVAMAISGHKTRHVFDRYNIVSDSDLREAALKLDAYREGQKAAKAESGDATPVH